MNTNNSNMTNTTTAARWITNRELKETAATLGLKLCINGRDSDGAFMLHAAGEPLCIVDTVKELGDAFAAYCGGRRNYHEVAALVEEMRTYKVKSKVQAGAPAPEPAPAPAPVAFEVNTDPVPKMVPADVTALAAKIMAHSSTWAPAPAPDPAPAPAPFDVEHCETRTPTPAPWTKHLDIYEDAAFQLARDVKGRNVRDIPDSEVRTNAMLMSIAPELLAALRGLIKTTRVMDKDKPGVVTALGLLNEIKRWEGGR